MGSHLSIKYLTAHAVSLCSPPIKRFLSPIVDAVRQNRGSLFPDILGEIFDGFECGLNRKPIEGSVCLMTQSSSAFTDRNPT